jgi:hypothetical protein
MPNVFKCQFCAARLSTSQGLRSHMTQSRSCHEKLEATYRQDDPHIEIQDDMTGEMLPNDLSDGLDDDEGAKTVRTWIVMACETYIGNHL